MRLLMTLSSLVLKVFSDGGFTYLCCFPQLQVYCSLATKCHLNWLLCTSVTVVWKITPLRGHVHSKDVCSNKHSKIGFVLSKNFM